MGKIFRENLLKGFATGLGWSGGVTVGFILISLIIVTAVSQVRAVPVIGEFFANIIEATQTSLVEKGIVLPK